jgi:1-acyl-sn-glycerol-3-phosphate acyltransferase
MTTAALGWAGIVGHTSLLLPPLALGRNPMASLHGWAKRIQPVLGLQIEVRGTLDLEAPLWVANHLSWVDPVILMALRPMGTVAKGDLARYPLIGRWARKAGLRFVERHDPDSRAAALAAFAHDLRLGRRMLLFPEGTTTRGEDLAPLNPGGLLAAWNLGLRVQPLRLASPAAHYPWTGDETLLPHLRTLLTTRTPVTLEARPPLEPSDFTTPEAWLQACTEALAR